MNNTVIENQYLRVEISTFGAELQKIENKETGHEYLWHGDKKYWGRRSPVLFPIVGKLWGGKMRYDGKEYAMGQHGFARDREFEHISQEETARRLSARGENNVETAGYVLHSDAETRAKLPFDFDLYIIYSLRGRELSIYWEIENKTDGDMWFQIGAHPAFNYKNFDPDAKVQAYLRFDADTLTLTKLENGGFASEEKEKIALENKTLPISKETLAGDALVMENQISRIELLDRDKNRYVVVKFESPAVGIWSPGKEEYAPFVCIEPWYGRCDANEFNGEYNQKAHINHLRKSETFRSKYTITLY